jgi:hypothetical protein
LENAAFVVFAINDRSVCTNLTQFISAELFPQLNIEHFQEQEMVNKLMLVTVELMIPILLVSQIIQVTCKEPLLIDDLFF